MISSAPTSAPTTPLTFEIDRTKLDSLLLGLVVIATLRAAGGSFAWRADPYEFVQDPPAIDLLTGSSAFREALEAGDDWRRVPRDWEPERRAFLDRRKDLLLYG